MKNKKMLLGTLALMALCASFGAKASGNNCAEESNYPEISKVELKKVADAKSALIVDVNGDQSYKKVHVPGAIHYAAHQSDFAQMLPKDKGAMIVAYCGGKMCVAWKKAAEAACKLGYTNIHHFNDGIQGWNAKHYSPHPALGTCEVECIKLCIRLGGRPPKGNIVKKNRLIALSLLAVSMSASAESLPRGPYPQIADCRTTAPVEGPTANHIEIYTAGQDAVVMYDLGHVYGKSIYTATLDLAKSASQGMSLIVKLNENYKETIFVSGTRGEPGRVSFVRKRDNKEISYELVCSNRWSK